MYKVQVPESSVKHATEVTMYCILQRKLCYKVSLYIWCMYHVYLSWNFLVAVGQLFAYEPPLPEQREERRQKQQLVQAGRAYHQMLYTLLNEVHINQQSFIYCNK